MDHYDSYTYNLKNLLSFFDEVKAIRVDAVQTCAKERFDAIVYSPGPGSPVAYPQSLELLRLFYGKKPFLGICLGMQLLGALFQIPVVKATEPKHGKTDLIYHSNEGIFQNLKSPIRVMRYHSLLLASVVAPFKLLAWTQKHEVMAIGDLAHRAYGVQFHPESILTESGRELIQNWIRLWK